MILVPVVSEGVLHGEQGRVPIGPHQHVVEVSRDLLPQSKTHSPHEVPLPLPRLILLLLPAAAVVCPHAGVVAVRAHEEDPSVGKARVQEDGLQPVDEVPQHEAEVSARLQQGEDEDVDALAGHVDVVGGVVQRMAGEVPDHYPRWEGGGGGGGGGGGACQDGGGFVSCQGSRARARAEQELVQVPLLEGPFQGSRGGG